MDLQLIREKQLVERWIARRLTPPEMRFFEDMIRKQPAMADALGLPDALKRLMRLLDDTGTEWQERPPRFWHNPLVPILLAAVGSVALIAAVYAFLNAQHLGARYAALQAEALTGLLNEPIQTVTTAVRLTKPGDPGVATYNLGNRKSPSFAELRADVRLQTGHLYSVRLQRDDGTFWVRFDNLLRDSNGELRFAVNSGALPAGKFRLEVRQVNLRGEGDVIGVANLNVGAAN